MSHYAEAVLEFRRRKDEHFAAGKGPVDAASFTGLTYFAPDPAWSYRALLDPLPLDQRVEFTLETNTGVPRVMARFAQVTVPLPGGERTLQVFTPLGEEKPQRVFIPFRDATSGPQTYAAGRYLDVPVQPGADGALWAEVDFNMAYHPYCAYAQGWTCPLPPRENWLSAAVLAGERLPDGGA